MSEDTVDDGELAILEMFGPLSPNTRGCFRLYCRARTQLWMSANGIITFIALEHAVSKK